MAEDQLKITLNYLEEFRTNQIEPLLTRVTEMKTDVNQVYGGDEQRVPVGNGALLSQAKVISQVLGAALTQTSTSIEELESRLVTMSNGIRDSKMTFDDLEHDAELDAQQIATIMGTGAPSGEQSGSDDVSSSGDGPPADSPA